MQTSGGAQASQPKAKPKSASTQNSGTHTIDIEETFYARAQDIYECFTQQGKIQAFTQSPAQAQPNVGGTFSMFGGSVQGTYRELQPFSKLTLDWRFGNWPEDCTSKVSSICMPAYKVAQCLWRYGARYRTESVKGLQPASPVTCDKHVCSG